MVNIFKIIIIKHNNFKKKAKKKHSLLVLTNKIK